MSNFAALSSADKFSISFKDANGICRKAKSADQLKKMLTDPRNFKSEEHRLAVLSHYHQNSVRFTRNGNLNVNLDLAYPNWGAKYDELLETCLYNNGKAGIILTISNKPERLLVCCKRGSRA